VPLTLDVRPAKKFRFSQNFKLFYTLSQKEVTSMRDQPSDRLPAILSSLAVSRRAFLGSLAGGAALALTDTRRLFAADIDARPRVVSAHHEDAVTWDYQTGWYGDHVSQPLVDTLMDRALLELTGLNDVGSAWRALLPGYAPGKKIAVKVNFNNGWSCTENDNIIDGLVEVVNAMARGLTTGGVAEDDIWIYDAIRVFPDRFVKRLRQKGVICWTKTGVCGTRKALFSATKPNSIVNFSKAIRAQKITDVLVDADYLINIPITKRHGLAGYTLGYKNHFGTIQSCWDLHTDITLSSLSTSYNPMVEYMANPHFQKTVLTIGDCLYGCLQHQSGTPQPWKTFGNKSPASLILSTDPVAADCVQRDYLHVEAPRSTDDKAESYLKLASLAGQGVFESTPASWQYTLIDYRRLELKGAGWFSTYGQGKPGTGNRIPSWRHAGVPAPGGNVMLEIVDGRPGSIALVLVGTREASFPHPLGELLIQPVLLTFQVALDGSGAAKIPIALPSGLGAVGAEFTVQAAIVDPGASNGVSHTGGLKLHIGSKV